MGDRFCCPVCLSRYDTDDRKPLLLKCSHTLCKQCITKQINTPLTELDCPIGRCPFLTDEDRRKPAAVLGSMRPNYALLQELDLHGGGGLVDMLEDMGLPSGAHRFVLDASDIRLIKVISTAGATSAVWKGMFEGNEVRETSISCLWLQLLTLHACMRACMRDPTGCRQGPQSSRWCARE